MKTIPIESTFYQCISDVIKWHKQYPDDWKQTWFELQKHYSYLQPIITQYFIDNKSEIWLLFLIAHSKR